jgi:hypothetical protein
MSCRKALRKLWLRFHRANTEILFSPNIPHRRLVTQDFALLNIQCGSLVSDEAPVDRQLLLLWDIFYCNLFCLGIGLKLGGFQMSVYAQSRGPATIGPLPERA